MCIRDSQRLADLSSASERELLDYALLDTHGLDEPFQHADVVALRESQPHEHAHALRHGLHLNHGLVGNGFSVSHEHFEPVRHNIGLSNDLGDCCRDDELEPVGDGLAEPDSEPLPDGERLPLGEAVADGLELVVAAAVSEVVAEADVVADRLEVLV